MTKFMEVEEMMFWSQGDGDNFLFGADGNDKFFGGQGNDIFEGGDGVDEFNCGDGTDTVLDYDSSHGDIIINNCEIINDV